MAKIKLVSKENISKPVWGEGAYGVLRHAIDIVISIYLLLIIVAMPFYYGNDGYGNIGSMKSSFLRSVSTYSSYIVGLLLGILFIFYIIISIQKRKYKDKISFKSIKSCISVTDIAAICYAIVVFISFIATNYREEALWGATQWYMGTFTQFIFIGTYFLISRFWQKKNWLVFLFIPVSGIAFLLGFLNRFGLNPLQMANAQPQFISTIGNINWYCCYLVTVLFGGVYLFLNNEKLKRWQKNVLISYLVIGFATLVTQGSSSGIMTLAVVIFVLLLLSTSNGKRMQDFWEIIMLLGVTCTVIMVIRLLFPEAITYIEGTTDLFTLSPLPVAMLVVSSGFWLWLKRVNQRNTYPLKAIKNLAIIVGVCVIGGVVVLAGFLFANTMWPGSIGPLSDLSFFTFSPSWGSKRGATWIAGFMCFWEQGLSGKLIGVGPDCMSIYIKSDGSEALINLIKENFGDNRLTNAHNEWLTLLVNAGILGLISYATMMVSAIVRYIKRGATNIMVGACGIGIMAYSINNMVSFQQSMGTITVFIILGIGEAYARTSKKL